MTKQIVWTSPEDGRTNITVPSDNVYVPADVETLQDDVFITLDPDIKGVTVDATDPFIKATHRKATIEEIAARDIPMMARDLFGGVEIQYHIVDREKSMGMDGYFRDAWVHDAGEISVDMLKAVDVHKQNLRLERAIILDNLDKDQLRALGKKDNALFDELELQKQKLRDITKDPAISAAVTLDELKSAAVSTITSKGK